MYVESGYNVVRVSMRIVLRIGPPFYTILVRSCVSRSVFLFSVTIDRDDLFLCYMKQWVELPVLKKKILNSYE